MKYGILKTSPLFFLLMTVLPSRDLSAQVGGPLVAPPAPECPRLVQGQEESGMLGVDYQNRSWRYTEECDTGARSGGEQSYQEKVMATGDLFDNILGRRTENTQSEISTMYGGAPGIRNSTRESTTVVEKQIDGKNVVEETRASQSHVMDRLQLKNGKYESLESLENYLEVEDIGDSHHRTTESATKIVNLVGVIGANTLHCYRMDLLSDRNSRIYASLESFSPLNPPLGFPLPDFFIPAGGRVTKYNLRMEQKALGFGIWKSTIFEEADGASRSWSYTTNDVWAQSSTWGNISSQMFWQAFATRVTWLEKFDCKSFVAENGPRSHP